MKAKKRTAAVATLAAAVELLWTSTVTGKSFAFEGRTGARLFFDYGPHEMWLPVDQVEEIWLRYEIEKHTGVAFDSETVHDAVQLVCSKIDINPDKEIPTPGEPWPPVLREMSP